ncbi:hypothetical protein KCU93_g146, partial [Aureobasidium melanogenum]
MRWWSTDQRKWLGKHWSIDTRNRSVVHSVTITDTNNIVEHQYYHRLTYLAIFFSGVFGLVQRQQRSFLTVQALKCAHIYAAMAPSTWQKIKTTLQISHDYSVTPAGIT